MHLLYRLQRISTCPAFEISILAVFLGFAFRSPYCTLPGNKPENLFSSRATVYKDAAVYRLHKKE